MGGIAVALILAGFLAPRMGALFVLGILLGATLYHSGFSFTGSYRRFFLKGDVTIIRAQVLMLIVASLLFAPVLASGSAFGREVVGAVAPVGWQVAIGAFLFGIGMQLGGGCGSGTLYSVGAGSPRMIVTLAAFCAGGFIASLHMDWWQRLPEWDPGALGDLLGWAPALALQLAVLFGVDAALRRFGSQTPAPASPVSLARRLVAGPWPLWIGALLLAGLNLATLLLAGHPWTITWAFTLWGAKAAQHAGWDPDDHAFWRSGFQRDALDASVLEDTTSVMDIGLIVGAFGAAALAGQLKPSFAISARSLAAAILGGLLMGYAARLAYGCNIGAFVSGVASTSLHGWLWIVTGLAGNWIGVRLRPRFGLQN
ncbi:MAG: YeeE/YedE family protein [Betaproteobacteria bacterium]|nr:YeeE/YedE family protein [Betaproteobacteria bacterium]